MLPQTSSAVYCLSMHYYDPAVFFWPCFYIITILPAHYWGPTLPSLQPCPSFIIALPFCYSDPACTSLQSCQSIIKFSPFLLYNPAILSLQPCLSVILVLLLHHCSPASPLLSSLPFFITPLPFCYSGPALLS